MKKNNEIDNMLSRLTYEIIEKIGENVNKIILVGIRTRGYYIAKRLQTKLKEIKNIDLKLGALDITFYRDDLSRKSSHPTVESSDINFSVEDKNIILVDDVLYTGRTMRAAIDAIFDFGRPKTIKTLVLVDRENMRELPIYATFKGKNIEFVDIKNVNVYMKEIDQKDAIEIV